MSDDFPYQGPIDLNTPVLGTNVPLSDVEKNFYAHLDLFNEVDSLADQALRNLLWGEGLPSDVPTFVSRSKSLVVSVLSVLLSAGLVVDAVDGGEAFEPEPDTADGEPPQADQPVKLQLVTDSAAD